LLHLRLYAMKKALITGADGFIGSHLTELLLAKGFKVKALSYYNSFNYWGWLEGLSHKNLEIISGDIRDPFYCDEITRDIDVIFHLAALIAIPYSYSAPQSYVSTNVNGTLNICQAALKNKVDKIIVTSTSEVYGTAQYVPIDENHPKQPQSPYSASKIGADAMALSYYNSFNLPVVIARPFNTFGPRQSARAIIPTIITQIAGGMKEIELGSLKPTRDFTYVKDTCEGFYSIAESDAAIGQEINIATNTEISIEDLFKTISSIMNPEVKLKTDEDRLRPDSSEVYRLVGDNNKLKELCGFSPKYSFEQGLKETIDWFLKKENLNKYKYQIYNI